MGDNSNTYQNNNNGNGSPSHDHSATFKNASALNNMTSSIPKRNTMNLQ